MRIKGINNLLLVLVKNRVLQEGGSKILGVIV